ncbi:MAG TPA: AP endonuclease, partial [Ruminiclostridium sp.]|nr:AP endonuclease [Ruminiclostridium sp.]
GVDPCIFLRDFGDRIYHVHMKDVRVKPDGKAGILGSHIEFGDTRRGWNFVSLGHGNVDFDGMIRELNQMGYEGPLSVEWEDSGMERTFGAKEAYEFTQKINFAPSDRSFDSALRAK